MLKGSTRLCANFARSFAGKQTRAASDAKQSSRGRLPYFYPASVPKQGNLSAKEYAEKLHQARLAALQTTLPDRCEFRNKGAPTVKAFYLTDSPFRISHFPPGIFGKFSRRLERLGVMYTTQRLFLINPIATDQFSRAALITALHNTTTTILPKIRQV
uniref:Uncharacterized protein n=1 Tax=Plectus sambesii TaxID=2011161 RepID=A0A914WFI8_9BILA